MSTRLILRQEGPRAIHLMTVGELAVMNHGRAYLQDLQPSQIDADAFSREALLLEATEGPRPSHLEVFAANMVSWPGHGDWSVVSDINVHSGAREWIREIKSNA